MTPSCKIRHAAVLTGLFAVAATATAQVPQLIHYQGRVAVGGVNFDGAGQFKFALVDAGTNTSRPATATPVINSGFVTSVTLTNGGAGYTAEPRASVRDVKNGGSGARLGTAVAGGAVTGISVIDPGADYTGSAWVSIDPPPPNLIYQTFWANSADTTPADGEPDTAVSLPVTKGLYSVLLGDATLSGMTVLSASVFTNPDVRLRVWFNDGVNGFQQLSPDQRIAAVGYAMMANSAQSAQTVADGAITAAKIATGAVGSAKIAAGAVGTTQLAAGAVTSGNIAPGAITSTQLAKPPRSGTIASSALDIQFNQAAFTVPFTPAFGTTPIVTLGIRSASGSPWQPAVWTTATTTGSFSGRFAVPIETILLESPGDGGSLAVVNGNPAIAYCDETNDDLKFVRASDASGTAWGTPITVDSTGVTGYFASLALINGNPAVAYHDGTNNDLKFVRASNASGTAWGTPVTVDIAANILHRTSLAVVNGNPAIAYYDNTNGDLKYVRASSASGAAWGTPVTVDSGGIVGLHASLAVVNGNPAIAYYDATNIDLRFVSASNATGSVWGTPVTLDSPGDVGSSPSLALINGNPAVAYLDATMGDLKFVRANNASGTAWGTPVSVDSAGDVGSLAVDNGNPSIAYYDGINGDLKFVRASNASGTAWGVPATLDSAGGVGLYASLAAINGNPAVAYYDGTNRDLKFVRPAELPPTFSIDWIALEP